MFQSEITSRIFYPAFGERGRSVAGVVDVFESDLLEQVADNSDHGVVVIDHQDGIDKSKAMSLLRASSQNLPNTGRIFAAFEEFRRFFELALVGTVTIISGH